MVWPCLQGRGRGHRASSSLTELVVLHVSTPVSDMSETGRHPYFPLFLRELRRLGYVEGENLVIERRSAEGRMEHYDKLAREAVDLNPDLIFATGNALVLSLKSVTATIPIVTMVADPVGAGFADTLSRPGGNITGYTGEADRELFAKHLEILREINPKMSRIGFLAPNYLHAQPLGLALREAADLLGVKITGANLKSAAEDDYRRTVAAMTDEGAEGMLVANSPENFGRRFLIVELAVQHRLIASYPFVDYARAGGLVAYAADLADAWVRSARYIDVILKGAKPAELPFYQPTNLKLVVNLKTARAIGIEFPPTLLARADEVIE